MKDKIFLDTNIILYQFGEDKKKKKIAINILSDAIKSSNYVISYQVIQEFSNVALNKNKEYFSVSELKTYLNDILIPLCKHYPSPDFYLSSLILKNKYKYSYYDTLIINAALELKCNFLYTEDLQENQKLDKLRVINPFKI